MAGMPLPPDLTVCVQDLRSILEQRIALIDAIIAVLVDHPSARPLRVETTCIPESMGRVLPMMLQAIGSSSATLVRLSDAPGCATRDCYSIARSIVELSANVTYLLAEGPTVADRALRHATQKAYQDLERESTIGGTTIRAEFTGRPDPSSVPGLEEAKQEFTWKSGRERPWVDASLDERIAAAGTHFGDDVLTSLHFARFMVYRHSSEILHGTLFGAMYFFGLTQPDERTQEQATEHIGQQHMMLLMACGLALVSVVNAFHKAYGFQWAKDRSCELTDALKNVPYLTPRPSGAAGGESA
jgi:hypothetical protein